MKQSTNRLHGGRAIRLSLTLALFGSFLALASWAARPVQSRIANGEPSGSSAHSRVAPMTPSQAQVTYGKLPLTFEANEGQTNRAVNFMSRGPGYTLYLTPTEAVFVMAGRNVERAHGDVDPVEEAAVPGPPAVLRMKLAGANSQPIVSGLDELEGKVNYFIGNDPDQWHTDIPTFGRVHYASVYEGVDMVYHGDQQELEYDFVVRPGADYKQIALGFEGASKVEVDAASGDLLLHLGAKTLRQRKPAVYQEVDGQRQEIASGYELKGANRVGFALGAYDALRPLVIDPVLAYSTYLGGSSAESANAITVDSSGQAYIAAGVNSANFPITPGAFDTSFTGAQGDRRGET